MSRGSYLSIQNEIIKIGNHKFIFVKIYVTEYVCNYLPVANAEDPAVELGSLPLGQGQILCRKTPDGLRISIT
jgi:hypothetical protein